MSNVHFILGLKGGVGKTQSAIFLAQALGLVKENRVLLIDLDPSTETLAPFDTLEIEKIDNMIDDLGEIDPLSFDQLIEIADLRTDITEIIIDSGASNAVSLLNYLTRNDTFSVFKEEGHTAMIHVIVKAGQELPETLSFLTRTNQDFPNERIVLWVNEYEALVNINGKTGVDAISATPEFTKAKDRVVAVINMPRLHPSTEAPLIRKMNQHGILFDEVNGSTLFNIAEKRRLKVMANAILPPISVEVPRGARRRIKRASENA